MSARVYSREIETVKLMELFAWEKKIIKRKEKQLSSSKQKSISRSELFYYWPKRYFCTRRPAICCQVWYWQDAKFISIFRVGRFQLREEKLSKALRLKTRCDTRARINKLDWNLLLVMPLEEEKLDFAWKKRHKTCQVERHTVKHRNTGGN